MAYYVHRIAARSEQVRDFSLQRQFRALFQISAVRPLGALNQLSRNAPTTSRHLVLLISHGAYLQRDMKF